MNHSAPVSTAIDAAAQPFIDLLVELKIAALQKNPAVTPSEIGPEYRAAGLAALTVLVEGVKGRYQDSHKAAEHAVSIMTEQVAMLVFGRLNPSEGMVPFEAEAEDVAESLFWLEAMHTEGMHNGIPVRWSLSFDVLDVAEGETPEGYLSPLEYVDQVLRSKGVDALELDAESLPEDLRTRFESKLGALLTDTIHAAQNEARVMKVVKMAVRGSDGALLAFGDDDEAAQRVDEVSVQAGLQLTAQGRTNAISLLQWDLPF